MDKGTFLPISKKSGKGNTLTGRQGYQTMRRADFQSSGMMISGDRTRAVKVAGIFKVGRYLANGLSILYNEKNRGLHDCNEQPGVPETDEKTELLQAMRKER